MSTSAEISFNPATLEPKVREILTAPGTDLGSISAKNVRTKLVGYRPILTAEYMKEHKKAFDAVIGRVFEAVSAEAALRLDHAASEQESDTVKDEEEEHVEEPEDAGQDEEEEEVRPKKKAKKASKGEMNDAELARQLSSEINGRTRRATTSMNGSASKKKPKPKRAVKKSAEMIASDSDDDASSPKKRKRTKSASAGGGGGGTAKGGFAKEYALSEPLAALLNVAQMSRPQVVKYLWVYIKGNDLQNPANKREILCDDSMRDVFNCDKIDMFRMNKVLGLHLHEKDE